MLGIELVVGERALTKQQFKTGNAMIQLIRANDLSYRTLGLPVGVMSPSDKNIWELFKNFKFIGLGKCVQLSKLDNFSFLRLCLTASLMNSSYSISVSL